MNAPVTIPATIRGKAALEEVRGLLDQFASADADIALLMRHRDDKGLSADWPYHLTVDEMQDVLERRREVIANKLENKGIRIAPDPTAIALPEETAA